MYLTPKADNFPPISGYNCNIALLSSAFDKIMSEFTKNWRPSHSGTAAVFLADRADELRSALRIQDPSLVAARSGVSWLPLGAQRGEFHILFWGGDCVFSFPDLKGYNAGGEPLPVFQEALLLYYLVTADGAPLRGNWVSFADLPNGRAYNAAFQGYSGDEISKRFGLNLDGFSQACLKAGGRSLQIGSSSYAFQALPRMPLLAAYWLGDEEFPSSCKILFDEAACHYLPIDACAVLGGMLTRKIIK